MSIEAAANPVGRDFGALLQALWEMTKPRITRLVVVTTALGAVMAEGAIHFRALCATIVGTSLLVAGANALNMFLEEDSDALMTRTQNRPLPTRRVGRELALGFGVLLGALGTVMLGALVNPLACELGLIAFVSYVLVYTPLKAVTQAALYIGAVPGALPPLLGFAGQQESLNYDAWVGFLILFTWQLPHFLAIAIFRRDEYARASIKVMPVVSSMKSTERAIGVLAIALVVTTLLPCFGGAASGNAGIVYGLVAGSSGAAFAGYALFGRRGLTVEVWARRVFFASIPHLVLVFSALAIVSR
jgi:heme o synthase